MRCAKRLRSASRVGRSCIPSAPGKVLCGSCALFAARLWPGSTVTPVHAEPGLVFHRWSQVLSAHPAAVGADDFRQMRALLQYQSRLWPSGVGEAATIRLAAAVLDEVQAACRQESVWEASALSALGYDLLDLGPHGLAVDTARLTVDSALAGSVRARAVTDRFPGGAAWAQAVLDRAFRVGLARDTWDRALFDEMMVASGLDPFLLPVLWFGDGRERVETVVALGLLDRIRGPVRETLEVLLAEWQDWETLGQALSASTALSAP